MHENLVKDVLSPAISSITRMNINERISFIKKKKSESDEETRQGNNHPERRETEDEEIIKKLIKVLHQIKR